MLNFGTFLLMQSPSMRPSQEIYSRAVDIAQAAETLGFRNVWLAEHHFSPYGYLSRPAELATFLAAKTTTLRVGTAVIVVPLHHPLVVAEEIATLGPARGRARGHRPRPRLPALRVRAPGARTGQRAGALGGIGRHHPEGAHRRALLVPGQALPDPGDHDLSAAPPASAPAHLGDRAEPRVGRGH